jgi:transposase
MLADTLGRPIRVILTAGQTGDITTAPALLDGLCAVLADKAYDSNALRAAVAAMGAIAVIPSNRTRRIAIPHDEAIYKHRNRTNAASIASSTSGASQHDMTAGPFTSSPLSNSPQQ